MTRILVLLLLLAPALAGACTCAPGAAFLEASKQMPLVAHARVVEHDGRVADGGPALYMVIEVVQPGRNASRGEKIKVWGDNGALCRPYVSQFRVGTEWVFALDDRPEVFAFDGRSVHTPRAERTATREAAIWGCGVYWLRVRGGRVHGELHARGEQSHMHVSSLLRKYGSR